MSKDKNYNTFDKILISILIILMLINVLIVFELIPISNNLTLVVQIISFSIISYLCFKNNNKIAGYLFIIAAFLFIISFIT